MLKTPEEIKNALANCNKLRYSPYCEDHCPYKAHDLSCLRNLHADAREYILRLEVERTKPLADMKAIHACKFCKHNSEIHDYCLWDCSCCERAEKCLCCDCTIKNNYWEWRGIKEEKQC